MFSYLFEISAAACGRFGQLRHVRDERQLRRRRPSINLGGDNDMGTPNFEPDYQAIKTPAIFLTKSDTDHIYCARNNLAPWVAFMRWHFCGEDPHRADFYSGGVYCADPWECKSKGF